MVLFYTINNKIIKLNYNEFNNKNEFWKKMIENKFNININNNNNPINKLDNQINSLYLKKS